MNGKIKATIKAIITFIVALAGIWLATSCTVSLSVQKNSAGSSQGVNQATEVKLDSIGSNVSIE